jgi:hypothetical protein
MTRFVSCARGKSARLVRALGLAKSGARLSQRGARRDIGGIWINEASRRQLAKLEIVDSDLVRSFKFAPRRNVVLILVLKTASSTMLKRLEAWERTACPSGEPGVWSDTYPDESLWAPGNLLVDPLRFTGQQWTVAWSSAEWIASCRNPYTRFISSYFHMRRIGVIAQGTSIDRLARKISRTPSMKVNRHFMPQTHLLTPPVRERLDYIIPTESLADTQLGPTWLQTEIEARGHASTTKQHPADLLSPDTVRRLQDLYQYDFELLGYSADLQDYQHAPVSTRRMTR